MKKFDTVKLFYDEYPYKISVTNSLCHLFRDKNLSFAKAELDALQHQYEEGNSLVRKSWSKEIHIEKNSFFEAKNLYIEFCKQKDFKLRVQGYNMQIYSHDYEWLQYLADKFSNICTEFWEPINKSLLKPNVIITDTKVEYEYKVTMDLDVDPNLANWITNNPSKAKAGSVCLDTIKNNGFTKGLYFYVRDEKILQLLNLFIGKIQRIDKIVSSDNSDK